MTTAAPVDVPTMLAEIKARIYQNGIGAITAVAVQGVLSDMLNVLDLIAIAAGTSAGASAGTSAGTTAGLAAGAAAAETLIANGIGSTMLAALLAYPSADPGTPGALWWDGGVLVLNPGVPTVPPANPLAENLIGAGDVQAFLLGLPTAPPTLPGRLWWNGAAGAGSVLCLS